MKKETIPSPETKRWVIKRKAQIVDAVRNGIISAEDACRQYSISSEELQSWTRLIDAHGVSGLRTTRTQIYRNKECA